ncbi:hypothetical protein RRF57_006849 [Xylaria bambusicola]|uniref:Uncharacterized protein n=1 Tax=Xylaria bambusicola TaxID=326684 RepID=A0AAN7UPM8_9PEZI
MNVNAISPAVTAREAIKGFQELEAQGKLGPGGGTYLFTGNALNDKPISGLFTLGVGKSATAATVEYLARTAYNDKPYRFVSITFSTANYRQTEASKEIENLHCSSFYYVDERESNGRPMYKGVNGDAHADVFFQLAQDPKQGPWQYTFSRDNGYAVFPKDFP